MTAVPSLRHFLALCLAVAAGAALAQDLVPVPALKARVTDLTGTLTAQQRESLEQSLAAFESSKGSQIAVLIVPTTKPEDIEQYSIRVAEAWQVGRERIGDGVIVVVAKNDHRLRIEVGRGLEGPIPDIVARRVIRETMAPHFVEGDFYGGLRDGTAQLMKLIEGEQLPPPREGAQQQRAAMDLQSLFPVLMVAIVVGAILTTVLGRLFGSLATSGVAGALTMLIAGSVILAVIAAIVVFVVALVLGALGRGLAGGRRGGWTGGWTSGTSGGGWSGGGSSGGSDWSGGGGDFGGGGASGSWGD